MRERELETERKPTVKAQINGTKYEYDPVMETMKEHFPSESWY